jgi:undecaprenyl-diphosphatase
VTLWEALGLGVLQGVTEFLPISSSGHLALAQAWLGTGGSAPNLLFNVVVHLGTLLAVVAVLWQRLLALAAGALSIVTRPFPGSERPGGGRASEQDSALAVSRRWVWLILLASIPTAVIGLAVRDFVVEMNSHPAWIGGAFLGTAALLFSAERFGARSRDAARLGWVDALVIGIAQGAGVLPGISRSGITISAALWRDVRADAAVEFSILVSVPAIVGANLLEMLSVGAEGVRAEWVPLAVGFAGAFLAGAASIKALQWVVAKRRLLPFAAYCALLGTGAVILG